jgi:hypothetical protein
MPAHASRADGAPKLTSVAIRTVRWMTAPNAPPRAAVGDAQQDDPGAKGTSAGSLIRALVLMTALLVALKGALPCTRAC